MSGHRRPLERRFRLKVTTPDGPSSCWIWTGSKTVSGYGQIFHEGRNRPATQVSWEIHHGKQFPDGMHACHTCDNPPCVNPAHIFPGTIADNARDSVHKGRHFKAAMTHCGAGHEFTPANTYRRGGAGRRQCRMCRAANDRGRRRTRRRAALERGGKP